MSRQNTYMAFSFILGKDCEGILPIKWTFVYVSFMHCCIDLWQLLEPGADSSLQRKKRQSQNLLQPYIAAKLDTLPELFTLGDEKKYNGYYNKPLPGQQQYRCFVLADLTDNESVSDLFLFMTWACSMSIYVKGSVVEVRVLGLNTFRPTPLMVNRVDQCSKKRFQFNLFSHLFNF